MLTSEQGVPIAIDDLQKNIIETLKTGLIQQEGDLRMNDYGIN